MSKLEKPFTVLPGLSLHDADLDQISAGFDTSAYAKEVDGYSHEKALVVLADVRITFVRTSRIRDPKEQAEVRGELLAMEEILIGKFEKQGWPVPQRA